MIAITLRPFRQPGHLATPTAVLYLEQAVASQPIEAAACCRVATVEYCALIDVVWWCQALHIWQ